MRHALALGLLLLAPATAFAQSAPSGSGFTALPSFASPQPEPSPAGIRWDGSFARLSSGFQVTSSRRFGTVAGPTVGFEGGRMWREGDLVYGVVGGFDYLAPWTGRSAPGFGGLTYTRDFAGTLQVKVGALVADNVLVYTKVGATALNETLRWNSSPIASAFSRSDVTVRPDARVGVEWAVTDRLTLGIEAGMAGPALR